MATTYAGILPASTDLDLKLKAMGSSDRALLDLVDTKVDGNQVTATYVYNAGLAGDRITAKATVTYDAKNARTSASFRLTSVQRKSVSETGEVTDIPIEAGIFWNYGGQTLGSVTEVNDLLQYAVGTLLNALTGANGYPTTVIVSAFDRRIVSQLF